jgi:hypothetical protein
MSDDAEVADVLHKTHPSPKASLWEKRIINSFIKIEGQR